MSNVPSSIRLTAATARAAPTQPASSGRLHAFDVFDTLITRCVWRPEDLFLLLGLRLAEAGLIPADAAAFAQARAAAEATLRARPGVEEVTLDAIHRALAPAFGWTEAAAEMAAAIEVATEQAAIRPIAANATRLARLQQDGEAVALLSDTYLGRAELLRLLRQGGVSVPPERVFASAEHDATKRSGRLFGLAAAVLGIPLQHIIHRGDHPVADLAVPRRLGLAAERCEAAQPNRHEATLHAAGAAHPPLLRSLLAGSARAARLSADPATPHERTLWQVGAGVAGPLLAGLVLWTLQEAEARRARRLHFVARDGQILLSIAEILRPHLGLDIECRYLLGSRQAWHLPTLQKLDDAALAWLTRDAARESVAAVLARAELDPRDLAAPLARHGLAEAAQRGRPASPARLAALLADPEVAPLVLQAAARRRAAALGYLAQEGLLGADNVLMVDLGWHGRLQHSLQQLLALGAAAAPPQLAGLYLALRSRPDGFAPEAMGSFLTAPAALHGLNPVLLELFCAANHGTVRGYVQTPDGRFGAELAEPRDDRVLAWGLDALQGGVLAFARELAHAMALAGDAADWTALLRDAGLAAFQAFRRDPDTAEAEAFGSFPHADGQAHAEWGECAPRIGALMRLRLGLGFGDPGYAGHWPEASVRRGGGRMAAGLVALKRLRWRAGGTVRAPFSTAPRGTHGSA
jgi:predicted HAD superfamily hydrolase